MGCGFTCLSEQSQRKSKREAAGEQRRDRRARGGRGGNEIEPREGASISSTNSGSQVAYVCIDHRRQLPLTTKKSRKSARETRYDGGVDGGGNTGGGNGGGVEGGGGEGSGGDGGGGDGGRDDVGGEGGAMRAVESMEEAETVVEAMEVVALLVARVAEVT